MPFLASSPVFDRAGAKQGWSVFGFPAPALGIGEVPQHHL